MCVDFLSRIVIAEERLEDIDGIRRVNQSGFKGGYEADVVNRLRQNCITPASLPALFTAVQHAGHSCGLLRQ